MNVKAVIPLVAGLGIGGFALKLGIDALQKAKAAPAATAQIWAGKSDIPRGTKITDEMLTALAFPAKLVPKGAIRQKDQIVGRVPHIDAPAGLPILDGMLLAPGDPGGVHVPPGFRAVAVKIDESSGVDFHLEPGSRVDVVGYFTVRSGSKQETIARTLIEDVEVAAVGARISAVTSEGEQKGSRPTRAVTLLVRPEKVPTLHLAEQRGKIKLSMRGEEDRAETTVLSRSISEDELLNPGGAAAKARAQADAGTASTGETPGMFDWVRGVFSAPATQPAPTLALAAAPSAAGPTPPTVVRPPGKPKWRVRVWHGEKMEQVWFRDQNSRERVSEPSEPESGGTANTTSTPAPSETKASDSAASAGAAPAAGVAQEELQEQNDEPQEPME